MKRSYRRPVTGPSSLTFKVDNENKYSTTFKPKFNMFIREDKQTSERVILLKAH